MNAHGKSQPGPASLLAALAAWREDSRSFHADRQLADRVLLATGWQCSPDGAPGDHGRVRWHLHVRTGNGNWAGPNVYEPHQPHPVRSVDAAAGQMPWDWEVLRMARRCPSKDGGHLWHVIGGPRSDATKLHADGASLAVALCALAVQAWDLEGLAGLAERDQGGDESHGDPHRMSRQENAA